MSTGPVLAVLAPLPRDGLRGRELVVRQREHARRALSLCASLAGAELATLDHDERGAPRPTNGWHWSLSHCSTHVAACVHRERVGIDIEDRGDVREEVVERVLSPEEIALFEPWDERAFLRAWTAKEAVLKEFGVGLTGLERCRIVEVRGERDLVAEFEGQRRSVWQHVEPAFVLAVSSADGARVDCRAWNEPLPQADSRG